jgi:hypothetical protein
MSEIEKLRNQYRKLPIHRLEKLIAKGLPPTLYDFVQTILDEKKALSNQSVSSSTVNESEILRNQYRKLPIHRLEKLIAKGLPPVLYDLVQAILDEKRTFLSQSSDSRETIEEDSEQRKKPKGPPSQEKHFGSILQLCGAITIEEIKSQYKHLSKQYHPDRVSHLGPKLQIVAEAEMKLLNEAYGYFKKKYDIQ